MPTARARVGIAWSLVKTYDVDVDQAEAIVDEHYRRARKFHDPNSMFTKIADKIDRGDLVLVPF